MDNNVEFLVECDCCGNSLVVNEDKELIRMLGFTLFCDNCNTFLKLDKETVEMFTK